MSALFFEYGSHAFPGDRCDLVIDGARVSLSDLYREPAKPQLTWAEELAASGWTEAEFNFGRDVARAEAASIDPLRIWEFVDEHYEGDTYDSVTARTERMAFAMLRNMREPKLIGVKAVLA